MLAFTSQMYLSLVCLSNILWTILTKFLVKANTQLDREARKRATSVFLVQRAVPMFPPVLSEDLCSLVPDTERLTFSAIFTVDEEGNVLQKKFAKTIIK